MAVLSKSQCAWLVLGMLVSSEAFTVQRNIQFSQTLNARLASPEHRDHMHKTIMKMGGDNIFNKAAVAGLMSAALVGLGHAPVIADDLAPAVIREGVPRTVIYSEFLDLVDADKIEKVTFSADGERLLAIDTDGERITMDAIPNDPGLLSSLTKHKVDVTVLQDNKQLAGEEDDAFGAIGSFLFPALLLTGLFVFLRRGQGEDGGFGMGGMPPGQGGPFQMGRTQSKVQFNPDTGVSFADVAGQGAAKQELMETVEFLKNPERYQKLGAKVPRGVLMEGPPGTGKTLLAKAVAGEAGVPFVSCSGSEFVEMFVGVGAARVRDLFGKAKKEAPCIIFIDEIDAVGRQRSSGQGQGNDEREQTINQILVEMDGFEGNSGVIVLAATNRADILDSALLRPGRFDRKVRVDLPDTAGRRQILDVHVRNKPLAPDVDLDQVARRTPGFNGASLMNLMNEAAIMAARRGDDIKEIEWDDIETALDKITVGLAKDTSNIPAEVQELVAYHEAGHALVGALIPDYDMVAKVSIVPRSSGAGGVTFFAPNELRLESGMYSRQYLEAQLAVALGGRLAEEVVFGADEATTGASNDLEQVRNIAQQMVKTYGFSNQVGQLVVRDDDPEAEWVNDITGIVDSEVSRLVNHAYDTAKKLVVNNRELLDKIARRLIEVETVSAEELSMMIAEEPDIYMAPYGCAPEAEMKKEVLPYDMLQLPEDCRAPV
eukprot:CAMPEP_0113935338 /NCGR_PEP_ID=MMETSP1339-20121228/2485_1 /TAXON_ID=94617 /ORGANISM="Fibrocapsa japonica" /LENGTH=714 /DNA_ID=CAMNT_0000937437 /DNA_START=192 /DNA_END=2336 /DNA_ORIENTATION=- /assembly_acc=CAM_ASM_000762